MDDRSPLARYTAAVLAIVLAVAVRLALDPVLGEEHFAYVSLFVALVFVGWYCGPGPALLALGLGGLGAYAFLLPPQPLWTQQRPYVATWLLIYLVFGTACAAFGHVLYRFWRRAEANGEAARASEERFRLIVDSARDFAIITLDTKGNITGWNRGAENLLGYTAEEVVGKHGRLIFTPEDVERGAPGKEIRSALEEGRAANERWHVRKDGTRFWGSGLVMPLKHNGDTPQGLLKIMRDRTEAQMAEERLREADRKKDEFLAMLAHELRNPLAAIQYAAEVARLAPQRADAPLEIIGHQVQHLTNLIDDLLDVSRISRGRIQLKKEYVEAADVVRHAVETARPLIDQRGHSLTLNISSDAMPLLGDSTRLEQVVVNLLTNAAKYTPNGGQITVSAGPEAGEVVIRVRDTGVGISEEVLPGIFELFSQVDQSLDRSQGGLGIGLSVVRALVEMHGGSVSATSPGLGRGSEFIVRLPLAEPGPHPVRVDEPHAAVAGPHVKVLVIEDNTSAASMLQMLLSSRGYTVEVACDGVEGLQRAAEIQPDVVLLDIGLPGIDGYEVARRLRSQETTRNTTIIGLSGYGQEADRERSREAGCDEHLVKPIGIDKLVPYLQPRNTP